MYMTVYGTPKNCHIMKLSGFSIIYLLFLWISGKIASSVTKDGDIAFHSPEGMRIEILIKRGSYAEPPPGMEKVLQMHLYAICNTFFLILTT